APCRHAGIPCCPAGAGAAVARSGPRPDRYRSTELFVTAPSEPIRRSFAAFLRLPGRDRYAIERTASEGVVHTACVAFGIQQSVQGLDCWAGLLSGGSARSESRGGIGR